MGARAPMFLRISALVGAVFATLMLTGNVPVYGVGATASISGVITVPAGVDYSRVKVEATHEDTRELRAASLNPDGSYEIAALAAGPYTIHFAGHNSGAVDQWHKNLPSSVGAEIVTLMEGQRLTGINATLVRGATISGTLTAPAGVKLDATIVRQPASGRISPVAADGTYKVVGLAAGSHLLWFSGHGNSVPQYYHNGASSEDASRITVSEGEDVTGIDATLIKGASISGTVTAPPGVNAQATRVLAMPPDTYFWTESSWVAADGTYRIVGLPAGQYDVEFRAFGSGALQHQWYHNATRFRDSTRLNLAAGQDVTGIDAALVKAASISGTVTAPAGVDVTTLRVTPHPAEDPATSLASTSPRADGTYTLYGLHAGSYKVKFDGGDGSAALQWYGNSITGDNATPIVLGTGEDRSQVDVTLVEGASISGAVTTPNGVWGHLPAVRLYAADSPATPVMVAGIGQNEVSYGLKGLPAGTYKLEFVDNNNEAVSEWYDGALSWETAGLITLSTGQQLTDINATLVRGGMISGTITAPAAALAVTTAYATDPTTGYTRSARIRWDSTYKLTGLAAGSYQVSFKSTQGMTLEQWYDTAATASESALINVELGKAVTGINATLLMDTGGTSASDPPKRLNDFNGDGRTDVIARDGSGELWLYPGTGTGDWFKRRSLGAGWNVMSAVTTPGDFDGDGRADVIARDSSGELWLYPNNGSGDWLTRRSLGGGWNVMSSIAAPGDFDGDGRADVIARDSSGELWLYPNNGSGDWLTRRSLGGGWNVMSSIAAPGDFNADGNVDLIARDKNGELWLYPGNGQSDWSTRASLGTGWNTLSAITAPGDMNKDGRPDVVARDFMGDLWLYPNNGAGDWHQRMNLGPGWNQMTAIL